MIELTNISKLYQMGDETIHALQDVNLKIDDGEYVAIIGPSGSGKSTLMNLLGCLDIPSSGEYRLNGQLVSKLRESQLATVRNKNVGLIFQNFNLLGKASAIRNVELPARYGGVKVAERHKRAVNAMTAVGLANRLHHKPTELSGGQQQRVAIARALVNQPSILLADEPTGALDSKTGKDILDLFEQLQRERSITVIVITHDPNVARRARRIITIRDGRIESDIARGPATARDGAEALRAGSDDAVLAPAEQPALSPGAAIPVYQETLAAPTAAITSTTTAISPERAQGITDSPAPVVQPAAPQRRPLKRILLTGVLAAILAAVVNVILGQLMGLLLGIRGPASSAVQVALLTVIGVLAATLVFALVNRFARKPVRLFRIIAAVALVISFAPDVGLATGLFNPLALLGGGGGAPGGFRQNEGAAAGGQGQRGGFAGGAVRGLGGGGVGAGVQLGTRALAGGTGGFRAQSPLLLGGSLMVLHVAAAAIAVGLLTRSPKRPKLKARTA